MPRQASHDTRHEEAERLKNLRRLLGFSQRQLAKEFKVSVGAISQWETQERTIPGPVLRLVELYEESLGMIDPPTPESGLKKINGSWASRTLRASSTSAQVALRLAGSSLKQLVAGHERALEIKYATEELIARELLENLGEMKGLLMKVGQMASYMDFALPREARRVLSQLQDSTKPISPDLVDQVFRRDLGAPPERIFAQWSETPFAAASIGQVHLAELRDGTKVAVKVQYPGITRTIRTDLANARFFDRFGSMLFRGQDKGAFLAELEERVLEECDYELEAKNQTEFGEILASDPNVVVPKVFPEYSTRRILTSEYIDGRRFSEFVSDSTQDERNAAGVIIHRTAFSTIFHHQVFNCDPHPGNYLFLDDGKVAFVDFGCVKHFESAFIDRWKNYARSVLANDRTAADRLVVEMGIAPKPEAYDFDYHHDMVRRLYEPWLSETPFRFNHHFVSQTWRDFIVDNPNKFKTNLPKNWVFVQRLQWGLYAVLADLGAEADWRPLILELLDIQPDSSAMSASNVERVPSALKPLS